MTESVIPVRDLKSDFSQIIVGVRDSLPNTCNRNVDP